MTSFVRALVLLGTALASSCAIGGDSVKSEGPVRVSDLQFIGTHNSYHIRPDQAVFDLMRETGYQESTRWTGPELEKALSYTHPPLSEQLEMGLRVFELDIFDDPEGGRFASPGFLRALDPAIVTSLAPVDPQGGLDLPGFKVFHSVDSDVRSQCLRLVECFKEVKAWSDANPGHMPVFIQIETKEGGKPALANAYEPARPLEFTADSWERLHGEILSVFPRERLFIPGDLKGRHDTVNAAVRAQGWPAAEVLAGKVVILLLDSRKKQDQYVGLIGAGFEPLIFPSLDADDPHTAWLIRPTPRREEIRPLVEAGFMVYTRADANSAEARRGDTRRAEEAIASGAQFISTDFPIPNPELGDYVVSFGGAYVRCNTVIRRDRCAPLAQSAVK